jgi:acyl dehydratase
MSKELYSGDIRRFGATMTFATPPEERHFEDYSPGAVHEFGSITIDEAEIIEFARRFDPQLFYVDPQAAKRSVIGGLIASGWYTVRLAMRLLVDHYIPRVASLGSPGVAKYVGASLFVPATRSLSASPFSRPGSPVRNPAKGPLGLTLKY